MQVWTDRGIFLRKLQNSAKQAFMYWQQNTANKLLKIVFRKNVNNLEEYFVRGMRQRPSTEPSFDVFVGR